MTGAISAPRLYTGFGMGKIQDAGKRCKPVPTCHLLQFQEKVGNILDLVSRLAQSAPEMLRIIVGAAVMFSLAHGVSQAPDNRYEQ